LQLWLQPNGSRLWRFAYRFSGKQKLLALGHYPGVSLAEARLLREEAKRLLRAGTDPAEAKKEAKHAPSPPKTTFREMGEEYLAQKGRPQKEGGQERASSTIKKLEWMLSLAYPDLADRDISRLRPVDVLPVLQAVEARGRIETARRLREVIGCVCRYAIATGRAETDPTIALCGALTEYKPKPRAAIIKPKEFGALLRAIDGFEGQPATAATLKLMALLFPRPGELRAAEWREFNLEAAI
jgi:integrase